MAIFIPEFSTKEMVKKNERCINNKTVESLLKLCHYEFKKNYNKCVKTGKIIYS
jgi:hypothetical protein